MNIIRPLILSLLLSVIMPISGQTLIYSWQSPSGTIVETGGTLEHINQNGHDLRNIKCGDYYTFVLNGDINYIDAGYNVDECSYMKLTLSDGGMFRAGDEIQITAMRNNVADRSASMCLVFHTTNGENASDVYLRDNNVWNNMGLGKDDTFSGGTEHAPRQYAEAAEATEATSFAPSTYTFVVPDNADGADYLRLTRYDTGNLLYVSHLMVTRPSDTAISSATITNVTESKARKYVDDTKGLVISRNGRLYDANGAIVK